MRTRVNKTDYLLSLIREGKKMTLKQQLKLTVYLSIPAIMAQLSSIVMQMHRLLSDWYQQRHGCFGDCVQQLQQASPCKWHILSELEILPEQEKFYVNLLLRHCYSALH